VFDNDYGTQIVLDSLTLNVRVECFLWAANRAGAGYLWGYARTPTLPAGTRLCSLTDPGRKLNANVIDDASLIAGAAAERARGLSLCASILAAGWTPSGRVRSARS
jgi:hypothetical protein